MRFKINFPNPEGAYESDYRREYDRKSFLMPTFWIIMSLVIGGIIVAISFDNIPHRLSLARTRAVFSPILIIFITWCIIFFNGTIYLLSKIIGKDYSTTKVSDYIEYVLWWFFPKKMYSRGTSIRGHGKTTIFYGVVLNILVRTIVVIVQLFMTYPEIAKIIDRNTSAETAKRLQR